MKDRFTRRILALCIVALFLLIPASKSFGQDATSAAGAGSKALLFSMVMLTPSAYNGGLGAKYYLADPFALRGSLQFGFADHKTPGVGGADDEEVSATVFGVSVGGEYHFMKTRVSPYAGLDLGVMTTSTDSKNTVPPFADVKNYANGVSIGGVAYQGGLNFRAGLIAGVEFFVTNEVSLGAEYNLGYSMTSLYDQKATTSGNPSITTTTKEGKINSIGINGTGAFTLAFYF
jgi:hypothetical protein